jgi:hypothetical protein
VVRGFWQIQRGILDLLSKVVDWRDQAASFLAPFTNVNPDKTSGSIGDCGAGSGGMIVIFPGAGRYS